MPRGDGTGPAGLGSMTGRGLGYCAGYSQPGYITAPGRGLSYGRGPGRGGGFGRFSGKRRGFGWWGWAPNPPVRSIIANIPIQRQYASVNQLEMLKQEKEYLQSELKEIQAALEDISSSIEKLEKEE
ncbi:MAG: DUF5320 domain-containing protein [Promethearchaeota archaeon]